MSTAPLLITKIDPPRIRSGHVHRIDLIERLRLARDRRLSLVAAPAGDVFSQADGTPWLATAGSGDVLAGIIGALLAQLGPDVGRFRKLGIKEEGRWAAIAALGAALHGRAGRAASDACLGGPIAAGGIADSLPHVWGKVSTLSNPGVRKRNSHSQPLR